VIDRFQQVHGEVDVHALHLTSGTPGVREIEMCRHVDARIVQVVECGGGQRLIARDSALLPGVGVRASQALGGGVSCRSA
jgi:hypothetical protein